MARAEEGLTLQVLIQPRASRAKIGPMHDGRLKLAVTAPPVDGEANAAVIEALAEAFGVRRGAVTIIRGERGRRKTVRIEGWQHTLTITRIETRKLEEWEQEVITRQPFIVMFRGPPGDVLPEGMRELHIEDGPSFKLYIIPVLKPQRDRQNVQNPGVSIRAVAATGGDA